jgi:NitT/TauT family transport system substrate-binding protein
LRKIVMQTDWFPQAEHGGFYQALVRGFYREAGFDVEILPGGVNAQINLKVARGDADFGMNRSDLLFVAQQRGLPLTVVGAHLQYDPQALMLHEDDPANSFADLDGRTIVAAPSMVWIPYLKKKYGIDFNLRPLTYSLGGFMADPTTIQQCFVTNEPFFARRNGARVKTLLIADSGYEAYHTIFARRALVRDEPDLVRRFVEVSLRGWRDYLEGDPAEAHAEILRRNSQVSPDLLEFSRRQMIELRLVLGDPARGDALGRIRRSRLEAQIAALRDADLLPAEAAPGDFVWPEVIVEDRPR